MFVPQILLLVVLMCMSLSLASFVCLTGPGELWRNLFDTVMRDVVQSPLFSSTIIAILVVRTKRTYFNADAFLYPELLN